MVLFEDSEGRGCFLWFDSGDGWVSGGIGVRNVEVEAKVANGAGEHEIFPVSRFLARGARRTVGLAG